jgi:hypothetical protein
MNPNFIWRVALFLSFVWPCFSQPTPEKRTIRVQIDVTASEAIKNEVSSYLKREFRALGDVEQVDKKPYLRIRIMAMSLSSVTGHNAGFALSVLVTRPVDVEWLNNYYSTTLNANQLELLNALIKNSEGVFDTLLRIGGSNDLQQMCKKLVADIDADYIEPERKFEQKMDDQIKKAH